MRNMSKRKKQKLLEDGERLPVYKAILILAIAVLLTSGITSIIYSSYKIVGYREFNVYVKVSEKNDIGFNLDPGVLNFGKVPRGASAKRNATVSQRFPHDVVVRIEIAGDVKDMVYANENYFILPPNITKNIEVVASVPEDQPLGNYSGKVKVYFERQ
jgi:hypothetical protein